MGKTDPQWIIEFGRSYRRPNRVVLFAPDKTTAINRAKENARMLGWTDCIGRLKPILQVVKVIKRSGEVLRKDGAE